MDEMDQLRSKYDLDFSAVHQKVQPADIRHTDRVMARVRMRSDDASEDYHAVKVWRMSPLGVELVCDEQEIEWQKGSPIDLELTIGGQRMFFEGLVVDLVQENDAIKLAGIRLSNRLDSTRGEEKRRSPRWICSDEYFPTCVAPSPAVINDFMHFQVRDISLNGLQLICSLRNKFLIPDMVLRITAIFPLVGDFVTSVKVVRVGFTTARGKDRLSVGVEFVDVDEHMKTVLGQYLIQFGNVDSLDSLRRLGYKFESVTRAVDFYYVKTEEDYREVLRLRFLAHKADGNLSDDSVELSSMGDINDAKGRIVIGKHNGEAVATSRVRFNTLDEPMEHERYVDWPDSLPRRDQIMEVSRVCTHPDYRRGDLLAGLLQFTCATILHPERPWVVVGSWPEMVGFYKKVGFEETGLTHLEPQWNTEQHILIGNSNYSVTGKGVNPIYWNLIWRGASEYAITNSIVVPQGMDRIRLALYRAIGPFARLFFSLRRKSK